MKSFLILSCLVVLAYGQGDHKECHCGAFVSLPDSEEEVIPFPPSDMEDCSHIQQCATRCKTEWEAITHDGDLCTETPQGKTVGQLMCENLAEKGIHLSAPHQVFLYFRVCGGPWMFDGQVSKQELQCKHGNLDLNCH